MLDVVNFGFTELGCFFSGGGWRTRRSLRMSLTAGREINVYFQSFVHRTQNGYLSCKLSVIIEMPFNVRCTFDNLDRIC